MDSKGQSTFHNILNKAKVVNKQNEIKQHAYINGLSELIEIEW